MLKSLTLPRLVTAITFIAILAMAVTTSVDSDTWWHLRAGQWIVEHGAVPMTDPFSHTRAGAPWLYPSAGWLAEVLMYGLWARFGYAGLNLFTAFFVTLAFVFVYLTCEGHPLLRAFTLVLAAAASAVYWSARPQIVSFALAAVFAYVLYLFRWRGVNRLWVLAPLMALWANAHGGFAIGFILIGLTLAGQAVSLLWRWAMAWANLQLAAEPGDVDLKGIAWLVGMGLACAVAVTLNPSGPVMLLYPFKTVGIGALRDFIQEWQSPNFHMREMQPFVWLLLATLAAIGLSRRRVNVTGFVLAAGAAYLGFLAARNIPLLAIVAPPVLTRHVRPGWADVRARLPLRPGGEPPLAGARVYRLNWILLTLISFAALVKISIPLQPTANKAETARRLPVDAVEFIRQNRPAGPMFNSYNWGGYLLWALYPDYPVYVDGRTDLYDDAFLREYLNVALGREGWQTVFERYGVNLVVIESGSLLGEALLRDGGWTRVYRDPVAEVYERAQP